jgi:hypothetical protein
MIMISFHTVLPRTKKRDMFFKTFLLYHVQQILTKFSIIFISKTKRLLVETFFVYEFYSSSPIAGFLLPGYIGTTLYNDLFFYLY